MKVDEVSSDKVDLRDGWTTMNVKKVNSEKKDDDEQVVISSGTTQYLREADAIFRNGFESEEMKETYLDSVFEMLAGKIKKLSYMKSGSFIMDNFISCSNAGHLLQFFQEITDDVLEFSGSQCSCHVLQKALKRYIEVLHKEGIEDEEVHKKIRKCFKKWSKVFAPDETALVNFMCESYSTHVARAYFQALVGVSLKEDTSKQMNEFIKKESEEMIVDESKVQSGLVSIFRSLVSDICSVDRKTGMETFTDPCGSPTFSILLKLARIRSIKALNMLCEFVVSPDDGVREDLNAKQLVLLCKDKLSSRVMESVFDVGSKDACLKLFKIMIEDTDDFLKLVLHPAANFIIQRMFSCKFLQKEERFSCLYEVITSNIEKIYEDHKMGVIQKLAEQCAKKPEYQEKLVKCLVQLFGCDEEQKYLSYLIATSSTYLSCKATLESNKSTRQVTYHGSMLLQALLEFKETEVFVKGLLELTKKQILTFISSSSGSHLVDAFYKSENVAEEHKAEFLKFWLNGCICEIACDKYGSRVIENLWKVSDLTRKSAIVEALSASSDVLSGDRFGRHMHRNFNVRMFVSRPEKWREIHGGANKRETNGNNGSKQGGFKKRRFN